MVKSNPHFSVQGLIKSKLPLKSCSMGMFCM